MNNNSLFGKLLKKFGRFLASILNIRIPLGISLLICVLLAGFTAFYASSKVIKDVGGKADFEEAKRYIEIKDVVEDNFIDSVDRVSMGNNAAAAMVSGLGDKWSYFMSASEYNTYQLSYSNEYSGIGMSIIKDESGGFQVLSISSDSPAYRAGLSAGMIITGIDGTDVTKLDADEVRTLIRSKLNTKFTIETTKSKDEIVVDCSGIHTSSVFSRLEKTEAGYVQISDFEAGSGQEAIDAIENLINVQGAVSLVIDVRNNPGGLMGEAQILLDHLLPKGVLFVSVDKNGNRQQYDSDTYCIQLPICVLINTETYDAAEILAAVLQENQWATIIGEPSRGSTRSQNTIPLADGSAIRLSTHTYLTASGVDIAAQGGVIPDMIVYNSNANDTGNTEGTTGTNADGTAFASNDEQLIAALKLLS